MDSTQHVEHGTYRAYNKLRCRCDQCREAARVRMAEYRLKRYGDRSRKSVDQYRAMHNRLARERGKAADYPCEECGEQANDWALVNTSPHVQRDVLGNGLAWSERLEDYRPLCRSCHRRIDTAEATRYPRLRAPRARCRNGHDLTAAGAVRVRYDGYRQCVQCVLNSLSRKAARRKQMK